MNAVTQKRSSESSGDLVLQEMRRIKDTLSASYGHDLDKLFASAREREKTSGHRIVNFQRPKTF